MRKMSRDRLVAVLNALQKEFSQVPEDAMDTELEAPIENFLRAERVLQDHINFLKKFHGVNE